MAKTAFSHLEIRFVASSFLIAMFYIFIIVILVNSKNLSKQGFKPRASEHFWPLGSSDTYSFFAVVDEHVALGVGEELAEGVAEGRASTLLFRRKHYGK